MSSELAGARRRPGRGRRRRPRSGARPGGRSGSPICSCCATRSTPPHSNAWRLRGSTTSSRRRAPWRPRVPSATDAGGRRPAERTRLCDARPVDPWFVARRPARRRPIVSLARASRRERTLDGSCARSGPLRRRRPARTPIAAVLRLRTDAEALDAACAPTPTPPPPSPRPGRRASSSVDGDLRIRRANGPAHALLGRPPGPLVGRSLMEAFLDRAAEAIAAQPPEAGRLGDRASAARRPRRSDARPSAPDATAVGRRLAGHRGRLGAAPAPAIRAEFIDNLSHELRTPLTTVSLLAETLPARRRPRATRSRRGCATGSARSRSRRATSSRWSTSCSTCRGSRAAARSASSTASTWARSPPSRPNGCGCSPNARASRLGSTSPSRTCRRSVATGPPRPGRHQPRPQRGQVQPRRRRRHRPVARDAAARSSRRVEDHGVGHPARRPARVFERFYKVDRARVRGEAGGTGLGLAIARHVVEQHGGRIWVELEEGRAPRSRSPCRSTSAGPTDRPAPGRHRRPIEEDRMDRLHVATLNIRNLADRWAERLPLLLADMAALQPDLIGLQEVVYVDAAGPPHRGGGRGARTGSCAAGPAGPSTATACSSSEPLAATDVERLDLGHRPVRASRAGRAAGRRVGPLRRDPPPPRAPAEAGRDSRPATLLDWLDECADGRRRGRRRRLQREPDEPTTRGCCGAGFRSAYPEANGAEPAVTWPSGLQAPGMDTDGDPGCLDYIWLRGAARRSTPGSRSTGRRSTTRRCTRRTTWAWPPARIGDGAVRRGGRAAPRHRGDWRRGARRTRSRHSLAALAIPACDGLELDVRTVRRRRPGRHPRRHAAAGPGHPGAVDSRRGEPSRTLGVPTLATSSRRCRAGRSSTSSSRTTRAGPSSRCSAAGRGADLHRAVVSTFDGDCSSGSAASRRAGRAGSTPRTSHRDHRERARPRLPGHRRPLAGHRSAQRRARRAAGLELAALDRSAPVDLRSAGPSRRRRRLRGGRRPRRLARAVRASRRVSAQA